MKEKNHKRKQLLKRAKELRERKRILHKDIASFMVSVHLMQIPQPVNALKRFLGDGWKGYHKMRGRQLIGEFEEEVKRLRNPECTVMFYQKRSQWADDDTDDRILSKEQEKLKIRERLVLEADSLLSGLIELSFNLDFEE